MNSIDDAFDAPVDGIYAWIVIFAVVVFGVGRHGPFVRSIVECLERRGRRGSMVVVVVAVVLIVGIMIVIVGMMIVGIVASLVQRRLPWQQCPLVEELEGVFYSLLLPPEEPPDLLLV